MLHKSRIVLSDYIEEFPKTLQKEIELLKVFFREWSDRVYLVGGAVRDILRRELNGEEAKIVDIDLEVFGIGEKDFENLMKKLGAKGVGKSFFVYKYKENIDISLPRVETKVGRGHKAFRVQIAKNEKEAAIRRDFKMNALMLNIYTGEILDFFGGIDDIKNRKISIINEEKFKEDSLRVLRAMQFSARFGYKIENKSCQIMQKISLNDLSKERIFWEFEKMFEAKNLHFGLYYLLSLKIFEKIFNLKGDRKFFFKSAFDLAKNNPNFEKDIYKFYFLYIVRKNIHKSIYHFLDSLKCPNEYYKIFKKQKLLPKNRTDRFLAALSLLYPLKIWLGNYKKDVKIRAKEFGIWENQFDGGVKAKDLLKEGFRGKELGSELKRRKLEIIRKNFKGRE